MFCREGDEKKAESIKELPLKEDLEEQSRLEMLEKEKPIKGILTVNVPFARGLRIADE